MEQRLEDELLAHAGSMPTVLLGERKAQLAGTRAAIEREGFHVVAAASSAAEAAQAARDSAPQLCLLSAELPGGAAHAVRRITEAGVQTQIAVLSGEADSREALACLRAGANGYLPRSESGAPASAALQALLRGEAAVPRTMTGMLLVELRRGSVSVRRHGPVNRALFYVPRLLKHLRRRLHSGMSLGEAWPSARARMYEYR